MDELSGLNEIVVREYMRFMIGEKIGWGMSRDVYDHPTDKTKVIKMEDHVNHFQNVMEWEIWQQFCHCKEIAKWLAPCHSISQNGTFLIMTKAADMRKEEVPNTLPAFLTDHKLANFGILNGQLVCRDYGTSILDLKLTRCKWGGDE